jgi:hypothetical protein
VHYLAVFCLLYGTIAKAIETRLPGEGYSMSQAPHYLDVLTHEIGPRPAASDTERQAAEWLQDCFTEAGVPAELHDFDAPSSPQSARMFTYLLAPLALLGIGLSFLEQMWVIHWTCWLLLAAISTLTVLDIRGPKGPAGLIPLLPKAPSQNVIAKSIPSSYTPGEKAKKIVLVANYDSVLSSPLMAEATAGLQRLLQAIANTIVVIMPVLALALILNFAILAPVTTWIFYFLLALCIPGIILLINELIARIMNRYSPGANNNASGVAAMLVTANTFSESQQGSAGQTAGSTKTAAVKLAAAEAKAAAAAKQSSKMPGVDYKAVASSSARASAAAPVVVGSEEIPTAASKAPVETAPFESVGIQAKDDLSLSIDDNNVAAKSEPRLAPEVEAVQDLTSAAKPSAEPRHREERFVDFETVEFSSLGNEGRIESASSYAALDDYDAQATFVETPALATEVLDAGIIGAPVAGDDFAAAKPRSSDVREAKPSRAGRSGRSSTKEARSARASKPRKEKKSFFSFGKKKHDLSHADDPSNWLGLEQDFDARKEGKAMGSWDNFGEGADMGDGTVDLTDSLAPLGGTDSEDQFASAASAPADPPPAPTSSPAPIPNELDGVLDLTDSFAPLGGVGGEDDDHFAWKGGFAGDDPIEDAAYASAEAARIRRKVLDSLDVELKEKEVWFVATGAHYAERAGIRAFMQDYGDEVRDALFINISAVGSGDLYWSTKESFGKTHLSSARLTSMLRRLARESQLRIRPWKKRALISDAGPILAAKKKAVSITRLNDKGIPFALGSQQDTAARLDSSKIDEVAELACSIIREA